VSTIKVGLDLTPLVGPPTGIHQYTRALVDELSSRKEVELSGWLLSRHRHDVDVSIPVHHRPIPGRVAQWSWSYSRWPTARHLAGPVDVVHGPNFLVPPGPRSLATIHDMTPLLHPDWVAPSVRRTARALRHVFGSGSVLHATSHSVANELRRFPPSSNTQIEVVHMGVTPLGEGSATRGRELAGADNYVLCLGTVERRKNLGAMVEVLPRLASDMVVVIAGPTGNDEDHLQGLISQRDVGSRFVRLVEVSNGDRAALVRGARALAFPSLYEGYGFPPLEAVLESVPVAATAVGALPELIGSHVGLAPPGQIDAFGDALEAALDAKAPPSDAIERVRQLTWRQTGAGLVEIYADIAGRTNR